LDAISLIAVLVLFSSLLVDWTLRRSGTYVLRNLLTQLGGVALDAAFLRDGQKPIEDDGVGLERAGDNAADDWAQEAGQQAHDFSAY
jgi:hypothetical protein